LLRLFPSRFREEYGEDALQLFRDRARDETGFFPALWLWMDLLIDLAISIPREYGHAEPELVSASAWCRLDGLPSFYVLQGEPLRSGSLLFGSVATLTALAACWIGETTGGAAHSGVWHRIDDHFGMGIHEAKPIHPYSTPDWAETGAEPDVKAKAEDALQTAVRLAAKKLQKK
jgi:hypothetical protein